MCHYHRPVYALDCRRISQPRGQRSA